MNKVKKVILFLFKTAAMTILAGLLYLGIIVADFIMSDFPASTSNLFFIIILLAAAALFIAFGVFI